MPDQPKARRRKHSQLQTKRTGWKAWLSSKVVTGAVIAVVGSTAGSATTWELDNLGSAATSAVCRTVDTRKGPSTTIQKLYCKSTGGRITISPEP